MPFPLKDELEKLYLSGKSMAEIAQILNYSPHKVVYWMDKYDIKRRSRSEASYVKLNPNGDPFKIKQNLSKEEAFLHGLGIGLYWGEGEKVSKNAIRVANTDPFVLKTFINFLLNVCGLERRKLFYSVICFNDSDPEEAKIYWSKMLEISPEKFGKIVQIPPQGKGTYKRKSKFGVGIVIVSNIKLKDWIMKQIELVKIELGLDSLVAKQALGKG